jgi:hypothetical protein
MSQQRRSPPLSGQELSCTKPLTGEGGVGVRLSEAERPRVSPIPTFPHQGGRSTRPPEPIECRTVLTFPRYGGKGY